MPGTWTPLTHQPTFSASTMLLLTDGTIICHDSGSLNWWRLTPDAAGNYINGSWSAIAPMHHTRLYYASAVLADGRVIVSGGEYDNTGPVETNHTEIYDPISDAWTVISPPSGWSRVGDAACVVLPDGRFLMGNLDDTRTAIFDPITNSWSAGPMKGDASSEETWTLLGDQTVLAPQCTLHPHAEKYVAASNSWVSAGTVPVDLVEATSIEIGPAFLLPDGRAFCIGATGKTALYTPAPIASQHGTWTIGPEFPHDASGHPLGAKDAPGCLLPNGKVLCVAGPVNGVSKDYLTPTFFFEFDGASLVRITDPPNASGRPYEGRMMLTPTGQVLFGVGTNAIYAYTPSSGANAAWKPQITAVPSTIRPSHTYTLHGRLLNGLSQAVSYGDDASSATNYPLVRIRNIASGRVRYCRTFDHSSMGVATGFTTESTNFAVPSTLELGVAELSVVVNGIASDPLLVKILPFRWLFPWQETKMMLDHILNAPLSVLGPNGPIVADGFPAQTLKKAEAAKTQILAALNTLETLGTQVHRERAASAAGVPPAVDTGEEDGDEE
jgi:hypothetical protein